MRDTKIEPLTEQSKADILSAAKLLLDINDEDSDTLLLYIIEQTFYAVMSYCHISVMPRQLESFIPVLAARCFTENKNGGVKSITEGERRVDYGDTKTDFLSDYSERLKPFMSRSVWVPSELDEGDSKDE